MMTFSENQGVSVIAEIGQAHDGSVGIAHSFIDALEDSGVNSIKWQVHIAKAESSDYEPFRKNFSYVDKTRYDYWNRIEFSEESWISLKEHCDRVRIGFMASPFSVAAVDLLERLGIQTYKVGSGEISNLLLLDAIARTGKSIILSSGLSDFVELETAINHIKNYGNEVSIMQCTTAYPTQPEQWGLNVIKELSDRFALPVGFSDHSGDIFACLAAVSLGAKLIEFHVTFDKKMFGPDSSSSLNIKQVRKLVSGIQAIERAMRNPVDKGKVRGDDDLKRIFGKSLAINKPLKKGSVVHLKDLESKKPAGMGIPAAEYSQILGRKLAKDLDAFSFITIDDLE